MQACLFGGGLPSLDLSFAGAQRRQLCVDSWVEHVPNWLQGHQWLFEQLKHGGQWRRQRRQMYDREVDVPRLVAKAPEAGPGARVLHRVAQVLSDRYSRRLDSVSMAYYRNGSDSVAPHGDKMGPLRSDTVIAILSLGEPRRFTLRAVDGSLRLSYALGWGDLLVMGGRTQETFLHGIPKLKHADPRLSLQFRETLPPAVAKVPLDDVTFSEPVTLQH